MQWKPYPGQGSDTGEKTEENQVWLGRLLYWGEEYMDNL